MAGEEGGQGEVEVQRWWESQWSWEGEVVGAEGSAPRVLNPAGWGSQQDEWVALEQRSRSLPNQSLQSAQQRRGRLWKEKGEQQAGVRDKTHGERGGARWARGSTKGVEGVVSVAKKTADQIQGMRCGSEERWGARWVQRWAKVVSGRAD